MGTMKSYVTGFALSLILTVIPLIVVLNGLLKGTAALTVVLGTAVLQFVVQLVYFMHLKDGENARWNKMALLLGLIIVVTIVIGSIWIMTFNQVVS